MPRIGPTELIIILVIIVIVFGIGRLPEVGSGLGKGIREFRRAVTGKGDDDADGDGDGDESLGGSLGEGLRELRRSITGEDDVTEVADKTKSDKGSS